MVVSYLIRATNEASQAKVKFRVRVEASRDAAGNVLADSDGIRKAVLCCLSTNKPHSGRWSYSISAKNEVFDHDLVTV